MLTTGQFLSCFFGTSVYKSPLREYLSSSSFCSSDWRPCSIISFYMVFSSGCTSTLSSEHILGLPPIITRISLSQKGTSFNVVLGVKLIQVSHRWIFLSWLAVFRIHDGQIIMIFIDHYSLILLIILIIGPGWFLFVRSLWSFPSEESFRPLNFRPWPAMNIDIASIILKSKTFSIALYNIVLIAQLRHYINAKLCRGILLWLLLQTEFVWNLMYHV